MSMTLMYEKNVSLAKFTSFGVGGPAENFTLVTTSDELLEVLQSRKTEKIHMLGFGSNVLISDSGLSGLVISSRGGNMSFEDNLVIVDGGVWWDDVVKASIEKRLWGIELLSEIPGSVAGALFINIAAYGQSIGNTVKWIDVWDRDINEIKHLTSEELLWSYKSSIFQNQDRFVIIRACLELSMHKTNELTYQKALDVADQFGLNIDDLQDRRKIIIESRVKAGSIWHENDPTQSKTVGSFFRNPVVSAQQAELVMEYDESGKTKQEIQNMNKVHGGTTNRVSAAHVMLASGFNRGQTWGNVKLNDQNLLKIEALPGATAQEIYDVVVEIQQTCKNKLGILLEPEAQLLGDFR